MATEQGDLALLNDPVTLSALGVSCRVFATQYIGYTDREIALPHRSLKERGGYDVRIGRGEHRRTKAKIKEVGPWNRRDDYWQLGDRPDMWRTLPRCKPEAEAAYFDNYNRGED
jgi:hypothetical protein